MNFQYKPNLNDYPVFYKGYIDSIEDLPLLELLEKEKEHALKVLKTIPEEKANFQYAPEKWTIKQVLMHIIDTEYVFGYRGLAIARGDQQALPGFDQDEYMSGVSVSETSLKDLISCYEHLRTSNIILFNLLRVEDLAKIGTASGYQVKAGTIGYFIAGHCRYHINMLEERYKV